MSDQSQVSFLVNGEQHQVALDPETALLYVLRNDLGLEGTMFGCGVGLCGSCFVLIDDFPTPACDTPLWSVEGKSVTTIEGLAHDGLNEVQRAFITEQAGQCGYCLSGIIVSATALLRQNPEASEEDVRKALDRNLCRCGSQTRIISAVLRAIRGES